LPLLNNIKPGTFTSVACVVNVLVLGTAATTELLGLCCFLKSVLLRYE
jgi:hypothetical protein